MNNFWNLWSSSQPWLEQQRPLGNKREKLQNTKMLQFSFKLSTFYERGSYVCYPFRYKASSKSIFQGNPNIFLIHGCLHNNNKYLKGGKKFKIGKKNFQKIPTSALCDQSSKASCVKWLWNSLEVSFEWINKVWGWENLFCSNPQSMSGLSLTFYLRGSGNIFHPMSLHISRIFKSLFWRRRMGMMFLNTLWTLSKA